jgi:hypothetical protein
MLPTLRMAMTVSARPIAGVKAPAGWNRNDDTPMTQLAQAVNRRLEAGSGERHRGQTPRSLADEVNDRDCAPAHSAGAQPINQLADGRLVVNDENLGRARALSRSQSRRGGRLGPPRRPRCAAFRVPVEERNGPARVTQPSPFRARRAGAPETPHHVHSGLPPRFQIPAAPASMRAVGCSLAPSIRHR